MMNRAKKRSDTPFVDALLDLVRARVAESDPPIPRNASVARAASEPRSRRIEFPAPIHLMVYAAGGVQRLLLIAHKDWGNHLIALQWVDATEEGNVPYLTAFVLLDESKRTGEGDEAYSVTLELPEEAAGIPALTSISPVVDSPAWFEREYRNAFARPSASDLHQWFEAQIAATGAKGQRVAAWRRMLQRLAAESE